MFDDLFGNELPKRYLTHALSALPQTLLFSGPDGIGKKQFALRLAATLLNTPLSHLPNHPDFHLLAPEGKAGVYAIETLRHLIDKEHRAPFMAEKKIFILDAADRMQTASANALLKTLEEPAADTQFFLITSRPQDLLPTILSRCMPLKFQPLSDSDIALALKAKAMDESYAKLAQGSLTRALELASSPLLQQLKTLVFELLKSAHYLETAEKANKIEELVSEIEDPVLAAQMQERLFALILMRYRDEHARGVGTLFFPEEPPLPRRVSLEVAEEKVAEALLASMRNLKLSVCLEHVLL